MRINDNKQVTKDLTKKQINKRKLIRNLFVCFAVAVLVVIALTVLQSSIIAKEPEMKAYTANITIPHGESITSDNFDQFFSAAYIRAKFAPEGVITDENRESLYGSYTMNPIPAGGIITEGDFQPASALLKDISNPVEVTFAAGSIVDTVAGELRAGDRVNIQLIYAIANEGAMDAEEANKTNVVDTLCHGAYVVQAYSGDGLPIPVSDSTTQATMFKLILDESNLTDFYIAISNGTIKMSRIIGWEEGVDEYKFYADAADAFKRP